MKLSLGVKTSLAQTLTPQQIQYLKLLQLPVVQLEQQVLQEIEQNPMLEEVYSDEAATEANEDFEPAVEEQNASGEHEGSELESAEEFNQINDAKDPFEFYKLIWQDNEEIGQKGQAIQHSGDDEQEYQIKDSVSFLDELLQQFRMLPLKEEEMILGEHIIGNVDSDGYLRRELEDIVDETNQHIEEQNIKTKRIYISRVTSSNRNTCNTSNNSITKRIKDV